MLTFIVFSIFSFSIIFLICYLIIIYNGLITVLRNIDKAWANILVLLKQRHDEIPKLVAVCEDYMQYEKEAMKEVVSTRSDCLQIKSVAESSQAEENLSMALKSLYAVVENYPALKSSENFQQLQYRISYLEDQISDRRVFYNESVNNYNTRICQLPDYFVAYYLKFSPRNLFHISRSHQPK